MDEVGCCWLLSALFIILTTFFSTTSLALRHASWSKLEEAFEARGRAERTGVLRTRLGNLLSCTATLRLLATLGLMLTVVRYFTISEALEQDNSSSLPLVRAFIVLALILSVFSVAIPHAWAKYAGTPLLVHCYLVLRLIEWLCWPLTTMLHVFDPLTRRLAGVPAENGNGTGEERQEELLNAVEEGEKGGLFDPEEREMIASVLEFRDTSAGEIMTPRTDVVGIEAAAELSEAADIIVREGHSRYPVYEENIDKVIGMLYAKDLLCDLNQPAQTKGIRHRLRKPYFVPESKTVRDLLHNFQDQKVHMAVVLDEYGGTAGVVTIEDVVEEIVGEIVDEYEEFQDEPVRKIDDQTIEVDARCHVDELNDELNIEIPEDENYETIGGFAFAKLGHIPRSGEAFEQDNLKFTVIDVEQRKINRVRIDILPGKTKGNKDTAQQ